MRRATHRRIHTRAYCAFRFGLSRLTSTCSRDGIVCTRRWNGLLRGRTWCWHHRGTRQLRSWSVSRSRLGVRCSRGFADRCRWLSRPSRRRIRDEYTLACRTCRLVMVEGRAGARRRSWDALVAGTGSATTDPLARRRLLDLLIVGIANLAGVEEIDNGEILDIGGGTWLAGEHDDILAMRRHAVTRSWRWRWPHVLKGIPATCRDAKGSQISQVSALLGPATKDVHDIVDNGGCVSFSWSGNVSDAVESRPRVLGWIVAPDIVEPLKAIGPAKTTSH